VNKLKDKNYEDGVIDGLKRAQDIIDKADRYIPNQTIYWLNQVDWEIGQEIERLVKE
jgi:hypothetical protein